MEKLLDRKLRIGIAACQYGAKTRYNGKGRDLTVGLGRDRGEITWTPVCPEAHSGMGIPRPTIKIAKGNGDDFWEGKAIIKNRQGHDKSDMMRRACNDCMDTLDRAEIDAYIYMDGSPSCGITRTTLKNRRLGKPPGVFGSLLLKKEIFLINSIDLESPIKWWDWKRRLIAFTWIKEQKEINIDKLNYIWSTIKYICKEIDREKYQEIEKKIEVQSKKEEIFLNDLENIKKSILNLLREPADIENIKKYLWENYLEIMEREAIEIIDTEIYEPEILRSKTHIAKELVAIEKEARRKNLYFRSSPINYKPSSR